MHRRGGRYAQIPRDAIQVRILYIKPVPWPYGRGVTEKFLRKLDHWGLKPSCVIFDLWTTFPKVIRKVKKSSFSKKNFGMSSSCLKAKWRPS